VLTEAEANMVNGGDALTWAKLLTKKAAGKLIGAFQFGYMIGTAIDKATGASDKLGDWLAS
jgi:hypothetical protein